MVWGITSCVCVSWTYRMIPELQRSGFFQKVAVIHDSCVKIYKSSYIGFQRWFRFWLLILAVVFLFIWWNWLCCINNILISKNDRNWIVGRSTCLHDGYDHTCLTNRQTLACILLHAHANHDVYVLIHSRVSLLSIYGHNHHANPNISMCSKNESVILFLINIPLCLTSNLESSIVQNVLSITINLIVD